MRQTFEVRSKEPLRIDHHASCRLSIATGTSTFLRKRRQVPRKSQMHHKTYIGHIDSSTEAARGHYYARRGSSHSVTSCCCARRCCCCCGGGGGLVRLVICMPKSKQSIALQLIELCVIGCARPGAMRFRGESLESAHCSATHRHKRTVYEHT